MDDLVGDKTGTQVPEDAAERALYQELIRDHSRSPRGYGLRDPSDAESRQVNPTCGDEVTLRLHAAGHDHRIESVSWVGHGCTISQSSASMLADLATNLDPDQLHERISAFREMMHSRGAIAGDEEQLGDAVALGGAGRYPARIKCAMLPWLALEDALHRF